MTANQREIWNLYSSGHSVSEIARATGRAKSTISMTLKRIKSPREKNKATVPCVYSSDCFRCPLKDCVMDSSAAVRVNALPDDGWW